LKRESNLSTESEQEKEENESVSKEDDSSEEENYEDISKQERNSKLDSYPKQIIVEKQTSTPLNDAKSIIQTEKTISQYKKDTKRIVSQMGNNWNLVKSSKKMTHSNERSIILVVDQQKKNENCPFGCSLC